MVIRFHKFSSILSAILWFLLGLLTIGSIAISSLGWIINLSMGVLFLIIAGFIFLHGKNLHQFYTRTIEIVQNDLHFKRFLWLDLIFVLSTVFLGGVFLIAAFFRVFGEGFAVFG